MTFDSALERLYDLANALERYDPELTGEAVLQARMFAAVIQSASINGIPLSEGLGDTLEVCRKLEQLLRVCRRSRFETAERLEA